MVVEQEDAASGCSLCAIGMRHCGNGEDAVTARATRFKKVAPDAGLIHA